MYRVSLLLDFFYHHAYNACGIYQQDASNKNPKQNKEAYAMFLMKINLVYRFIKSNARLDFPLITMFQLQTWVIFIQKCLRSTFYHSPWSLPK